ncbi:unnamed protein product [Symbiodinium sp. CCMP2592]|nr:unnamed protein product [Symbiodinium sp. CCMP2592]
MKDFTMEIWTGQLSLRVTITDSDSKATVEYPPALCDKFANLIVEHLEKIAKVDIQLKVDDMASVSEQDAHNMQAVEGTMVLAPSAYKSSETKFRAGNYGKVESPAKHVSEEKPHLGGMRNPALAVLGLPSTRALGVRMMSAWESFATRNPKALHLAERYGTKDAMEDVRITKEWRSCLRKVTGSKELDAVRLKEPQEELITAAEVLDVAITFQWRRYGARTISKLGSILKTKQDGSLKRRIVTDLKRSTGNKKAKLRERLTLPSPKDVIKMAKFQHKKKGSLKTKYKRHGWDTEDWAKEWVIIDVHDAFMHLAVHPDEIKHCMAPSPQEGEIILFIAVLFGFNTAPLAWARLAASTSRILQCALDPVEAAHQTYLDDDSASLLQGWGSGKAPIKELCRAAGKAAWLSGIFPCTRATRMLYAALHSRFAEVASGTEERRRQARKHNTGKEAMFYVSQLNHVHLWLLKLANAVESTPTRCVNIMSSDLGPQAVITTDASPMGLGAYLTVNGVVTKFLEARVTKQDAEYFGLTHGASNSHGIGEALTVLVAVWQWQHSLADSVTLTFRSDSIIA